jgi:hypothetical protein
MPVLTGRLIRLEPLVVEHADGYLAAAGTGADAEEVFRWLGSTAGAPRTIDDARAEVTAALYARARGERFPYAQFDLASGEFAGTSSYYDIRRTSARSRSATPGSADGGGAPGTTPSPNC